MLGRKGLRPEEGPGLCVHPIPVHPFQALLLTSCLNSFLNDIERVTAHDYQPSDSDVVRARLRTMGVQEHRFVFEKGDFHTAITVSHVLRTTTEIICSGSETGQQWLIYDVGGARSLVRVILSNHCCLHHSQRAHCFAAARVVPLLRRY